LIADIPERTVEIVKKGFDGARSVLWGNVNGPGTFNKRRRGKDRVIVLSINIENLGSGGSRLDRWASQTNRCLILFVNFAGVVNRRKTAIARGGLVKLIESRVERNSVHGAVRKKAAARDVVRIPASA
jgi:hypothetical protein